MLKFMNMGTKISSATLSNWLSSCIATILHPAQVGFVPGQHGTDYFRFTFDVLRTLSASSSFIGLREGFQYNRLRTSDHHTQRFCPFRRVHKLSWDK